MTRSARIALLFSRLGLGLTIALGATAMPPVAGAAPAGTPQFVQKAEHGINVTLRYQVLPPFHPSAEDDPGPFLTSGEVGIAAGPAHTASTFSLASLGALAPNPPQNFPIDAEISCGASGPMAIEPLSGSAYPAVVVTTIVVVKGCFPLAHVFAPLGDASPSYVALAGFIVGHPTHVPLGAGRFIPPHADGSLRVSRVRTIVLPNPPAGDAVGIRNWTIAIVDGVDGTGKATTIAIDRPKTDELPDAGETLSLYTSKTPVVLSTLHLSSDHEARYERLHPATSPSNL